MPRHFHRSMLVCAILFMALVSGPLAQARGPDTTLATRVVYFSTTDSAVAIRCAAILLTANRMMTAAHCVEKSPKTITIYCPHNDANTQQQILTIVRHTTQDVAIITLNENSRCSSSSSVIGLSHQAATRLFTINLANTTRNELDILQTDSHTYIVEDKQCLTQGDSGTPAFTNDQQGETRLAAILISGSSDCPALQILADVSAFDDWVETVLVAPVSRQEYP